MEFSIWAYFLSSFVGAACYSITGDLWKDGRKAGIELWFLLPLMLVSGAVCAGALFISMDCINTMTPNPIAAWLIFLITFLVCTAIVEYALKKWRS